VDAPSGKGPGCCHLGLSARTPDLPIAVKYPARHRLASLGLGADEGGTVLGCRTHPRESESNSGYFACRNATWTMKATPGMPASPRKSGSLVTWRGTQCWRLGPCTGVRREIRSHTKAIYGGGR
jgi:hypothetical protein